MKVGKPALLIMFVVLLIPSSGLSQSITVVTSPSWGTVARPTSGTCGYLLSPTTVLVSVVSGSGFSFLDGGAGSCLLTGLAFRTISYSVSVGPFSGTGISVTAAYIGGNSSSGSTSFGLLGTLTLGVGGILSVSSSASAGIQSATVTVTVSYT